MSPFNLSSAFITFFAVVGPPKVLLAFAHVARNRTSRELIRVASVSSAIAAVLGIAMAYLSDFLTDFFHIGDESLKLAGGLIFTVYAIALVLGIHLGSDVDEGTLVNPLAEGVRELLLPFVASPLAMTAVLVETRGEDSLGWNTTIAVAYTAVVAIDLLSVVALAPVLRRTHQTSLEVLSRLLGLLLAAVGVELFLSGLAGLGVPTTGSH
ncbi:MarC family protein [Kitasatospora sp. NPDC048540]|uniref:MarC family protein n=1 Tax=unclassified Kitasatospora TaxID=2633591 RepID=UPI00053A101E|nr:MarC family protein [Kitasatospora sp. MBT63]